ncbi:MAG: hypothetical protein HHAS10_05380 [Candidatus Altimarinota bacterium]
MGIGLAIGLALDFGGLIGQGDGIGGDGDGESSSGSGGDGGSFLSDAASMLGGSVDERRMIRIPLRKIPYALRMLPLVMPSLALAAEKSGAKGWGDRWAIYVGPIFTFALFYVTIGGCFGGFNCFAWGGGLKLGNIGLGVLFPIGK